MKRFLQPLISVLVFIMVVTVSLPMRSYNIMASDNNFTYVTVVDSDTQIYKTAEKSVGDFLRAINIGLLPGDACNYFLSDVIHEDMEIYITRGLDITAGIDGSFEARRIPAGTTAGQLQTLLQHELDMALLYNGDADHVIEHNERLSFVSWRGEFHMEAEVIPYEIVENKTPAVRDGLSHVRQEGAAGEQMVTTATVLIGGREIEREITEAFVIYEPISKIVDVGVGGRLGYRVDTSAPDFHYREKMVMNASAYTAGFSCTGKNPGDPGYGITASGRHVQPGIVSVDPRVIPLGTNLYVEGYGFSLAADTGGAIKGHKIDLFYDDLDDALRFGRRNLVVYVLD